MKKRILFLALCLVLGLSLVPTGALATDTSDWINVDGIVGGKIDFDESTGMILECEQTVTSADIPEVINGVTVTSIDYGAFSDCKSLERVTIPETVTKIDYGAFRRCTSLKKVKIPGSVNYLGYCTSGFFYHSCGVFTGCTELTTAGPLESGSNIEFGWTDTIPQNAFRNCEGLENVLIPDGISEIGAQAFSGCSNLTSITISESVTTIGNYAFANAQLVSAGPIGSGCNIEFGWNETIPGNAFSGCSGLVNIIFPNNITTIGEDAFHSTGFESLNIPESVTTIGSKAFEYCENLNKIIIPSSTINIGSSVFLSCPKLTSAGPIGSDCNIEFGWTEMIPDYAFSDCDSLISFVFPEEILTIGGHAFASCDGLTNMPIPDGVTSIGEAAFQYCTGFTNITLPEGLVSIGKEAFSYCTGLSKITIPNSVTSMGIAVFEDCPLLTSAGPNGSGCAIEFGWTEIIPAKAFYDCSSLTRVTIPNGVTSIGCDTFGGCDNLVSVATPDSVCNIGARAFYQCYNMTSFKIPDNLTCIESHVFYQSGLTSILIPENVTRIGDSAFYGTSLSDVTMLGNMLEISSLAFSSCKNLTNVTFPGSLASVGSRAFSNFSNLYISNLSSWCKNDIANNPLRCAKNFYVNGTLLTTLTIPDDITSISPYLFYGCKNLKTIIYPDGLTSIGDYAFYGCENLKTIIPSDNLTYVGNYAFYGCKNLETTIDGLTYVGNYAFYDCDSLRHFTFLPDVFYGNYAFNSCNNLTKITIDYSAEEIDGKNGVYTRISWPHFYGKRLDSMGTTIDFSILTDVYFTGPADIWAKRPYFIYGTVLIDPIPSNATVHLNSTGPKDDEEGDNEEEDTSGTSVHYFSEWDAEARIAYWGDERLHLGSEVSDGITDVSFLDNIGSLIGSYVLAETKAREDNDVGPNILLSITPVETKIGIVNSLDETTITIDGVTYTLSDDLQGSIIFRFPEDYLGKAVLFHTSDDSVVGIQLVSDAIQEKTGFLLFWNEEMHAALIAFDDENGARYCTLYSDEDSLSLDLLKNNLYTDIKCNMIGYTDIVYSANSYSRETDPDSEAWFDYNQSPATDEDNLVTYYANKWYDRYEEFVAAMQEALSKYAGSSEGEKKAAIESCMKEMQENDKKSNSKYLSGTSIDNAQSAVKEAAYRGLATVLYDTATDPINLKGIDLSSATAGVDLVKRVLGATSESSRSCVCGKYKVTVKILSCSSTYFGKLTVIDSTRNKTVASATVCSVRSQAGEAMKTYFDNLTELEKNALKNIYSEISKDVLGQSINSFTKDWMDKAIKKYADKYLSTGVGQLAQNLNTCYNYYLYVGDMMDTAFNAPEDLLIKIGSMEFKDTSITDKAVKKAMSNLEAAKDKLNDVLEAYINGTLNASILDKITLYFNCPVNVAVFDSSGNQIGYVGEDDLWYGDEISIEEMGGAKIIHSYTDDTLSFQIVGSDYGTMSCTIEECDASGDPIGRAVFYDIPIEPSGEFTLNQPENIPSSMDTLALSSSEGNIPIDEYITVNQNGSVSIDCTVETENNQEIGGAIIGTGKYVKGNAVVLRAIPEDGYHFVGWFLDDVLIEVSQTYEFTAKENLQLVAVFSEDFEITEYSITYNLESGTLKEGESNPTVYTELSEEITLINPTRTHYTFAGWIGTDLTEATKTVIIPTGSTGDRTYTATWVRNSGSSESGFAEIDCVSDTSVQLYLSNEEAGTCIVGIYDERGKMIAVGTKAVEAEAREITISYNQVKLPEHYTVKVFLADETNAPLCEAVLQEY